MLIRCSCVRDSSLEIVIQDPECQHVQNRSDMKKLDTGREQLVEMLVETLTSTTGAGSDLPAGDYDDLDERLWLQGYQGSLDVGQLANVILQWTDTL